MESNRPAVVVEQDEEVEEARTNNNDDSDGRHAQANNAVRRDHAVAPVGGDVPMGGAGAPPPAPHLSSVGGGAQMVLPQQPQQLQMQMMIQQQHPPFQQQQALIAASTTATATAAAMEPMHVQLAQYEARMRDSAAAFASAAAGAAWAAAHLAQTSSSLQLQGQGQGQHQGGAQQASGMATSSSTFAATAAAQSAFEVAAAAATNVTAAGMNNNVFGGQQLMVSQGPALQNVAGFPPAGGGFPPMAQGSPAAFQQQQQPQSQPQLQVLQPPQPHGSNMQMVSMMPGAPQYHHQHQLEHGAPVAMEGVMVDERAGTESGQGRSLWQPPRRQRERGGTSPRSSAPMETDRGTDGGIGGSAQRSHRRDGGNHHDEGDEDDGQLQPNKRHQRMARHQSSSGSGQHQQQRDGSSIHPRHRHSSGHHHRENNDDHVQGHSHDNAHEQANQYCDGGGREQLPDGGRGAMVAAVGHHTSNKRRHSNTHGQQPRAQRDQHWQSQRPAQFSQPQPQPQPQLQLLHQQHHPAQVQQPPQQVQSMSHFHGNHHQGVVVSSGHGTAYPVHHPQQPQRHRTLFDPYSSSQRPRKKGAAAAAAASGCPPSSASGGVKSSPASASGKGRRRLHHSSHQHGADGNSSGGGSSNSGRHTAAGGGGRGGKKKQKGTRYNHGQHQHPGSGHQHHNQQQHQPRPFNPVGKTGVMALHELCRKRHWEPPRFVEVEVVAEATTRAQSPSQRERRGDGDPKQNPPAPTATTVFSEFLMSVIVEGRELGRGRGGTKAAARQDASRRALLVLLPGIGFDENGVLVEAPPTTALAAAASASCPSPAWHPSEDLAPKLASGLAIDIDRGRDGDGGGASSPVPSEDSSVRSMESSLASNGGGGVGSHKGPPRRSAVYPSSGNATTTTSGGEDDDAYYASRGASVCSTLLHAMWQIDERIGEPPTYEFDFVRPSAMMATASASTGGQTIAIAPHRSSFECTASLSLRGCAGGDVDDRTSTNTSSHDGEPPTRRLRASASSSERDTGGTNREAACDMNMRGDADLDTGGSDFGEEDTTERKGDSTSGADRTQLLKAVGTGATKREARHAASAKLLALLFPSCSGTVEVIAAAEQKREEYAASKARQSKQSKKRGGSGGSAASLSAKAAKRGGRHRSDFFAPAQADPSLPVDVSQRIRCLAGLEVLTYRSEDEYSASTETLKAEAELRSSLPPSPRDTTLSSDSFISVENLSLSERNDDLAAQGEGRMAATATSPVNASVRRDKPVKEAEDERCIGNMADVKEASIRQLARQRQLEEAVDDALQRLHDLEDDGRASFGGLPGDDDVGKIVLRRATMDDSAWVAELLSMKTESKVGGNYQDDRRRTSHAPSQPSSASQMTLGPVALLSPFHSTSFPKKDLETEFYGDESPSDSAPLLWGGLSTILVLSRVFSGQNEPPLACAVLTVGFSVSKGRLLKISDLKHKEHLPRERFIECLDALASSMNCTLENTLYDGSVSVSPSKMSPNDNYFEMSRKVLTRIVESYTSAEFLVDSRSTCDRKQSKLPLVSERPMPGTLHIAGMQQTLQSVKEEESGEEEKDIAVTTENEKCNKASGQTQDKPSKRTRVS